MSKYSLLIILLSFISFNSKKSSIITIPLKLVNKNFEKYPRQNFFTIEKEEKAQTIFGTKIRNLKEEIAGEITILNNGFFAAPIEIGNQQFYVILDTGSTIFWIPLINSIDQYEIDRHYSPGSSAKKTNETFEIKYDTQSTKGYYYTDYVKFIANNAYTIKFGAANETVFNVKGADGVMSLAKDYKNYEYSPIWTLYTKGQINKKSFSFKYIGDDKVDMYLGSEHEDFKNTPQTVECKLLNETYYDTKFWTCKLFSFGFISKDHKKNNTVEFNNSITFDTGTSGMILPYDLLKNLTENLTQFSCCEETIHNGIQIKCEDINNLPNITLGFGDYHLVLNDKMYNVMKKGNKEYYILNAVFAKDLFTSIIGQPFFQIFHTRFDYENKVLKFYSENKDSIFPPRISDGTNWLDGHYALILLSLISILIF